MSGWAQCPPLGRLQGKQIFCSNPIRWNSTRLITTSIINAAKACGTWNIDVDKVITGQTYYSSDGSDLTNYSQWLDSY